MAVLTESCAYSFVIQTHGNILLACENRMCIGNVNSVQVTEVQMALCHWVSILLSGIKCSKLQNVSIESPFFSFFSWYVMTPHYSGTDHILVLGCPEFKSSFLGSVQRTVKRPSRREDPPFHRGPQAISYKFHH